MVNKIVELYQRELHFYTGNYSYYMQEKEIRVDMQKKAFENQQDYIRQQERFVERFKAKASKAAAAQSIVKRLDKIERIEDVNIERPNMKINFVLDKTPGKVVATLKHVSKSFGDVKILENTGAEIDRGDKIALIGANGKGKSTLLRIVVGTESFEGQREWGHNVDESFYAQHQLEVLNPENDLVEEMQEARSGKNDLELRSLLGAFLFSGDAVDKKIKVLSGGEKARVALAKTIASKANFLMLDEPTNHLDIHSVDLLVEALNKYEGTIILVSHDRYFISRIANKIWEIEDHKIREFKGTYAEWEDWKDRRDKAEAAEKKNQKVEVKVEKPVEVKKEKAPQTPDAKKEAEKIKKQFGLLEEKIAKLNKQKMSLENDLGTPDIYSNKTKFAETEAAYKKVNDELTIVNKEYEVVFEKMMELN
jgi:ATP-binding cassette subfamily F protein 3